jgi:large subunit ribosomal protein L22
VAKNNNSKTVEELNKNVVSSTLSGIDVSPQKLRLVADLIRGKDVVEAGDVLKFTRKKGARRLEKLLKSAVSNAEHNFNLQGKNLYVSKIYVNEGIKLPRYRFASRGRVNKLVKRRSQAVIELSPKNK